MVSKTLNEREGYSHLNYIDSTFVVSSTKCHQIQGDWYQEPKMKKKRFCSPRLNKIKITTLVYKTQNE
jgi:hypothetical protein